MILPVFLAGIVSFGYFPEVFSKNLPIDEPDFSVGRFLDSKPAQLTNRGVIDDIISYMANQAEVNVQIDEYETNEIDTDGPENFTDELKQTYLVVKTKTTRSRRGKRYYQIHHTLCHFKICNMGKRRRIS